MVWRNKEEEKLERREESARQGKLEGSSAAAGEKPKKTWKEIDAKRDGARGRRDDGDNRGKRAGGESAAYRSYKSKLDRMFDGQKPVGFAAVVATAPHLAPAVTTAAPGSGAAPVSASASAAPAASPKDRLAAAQTDADLLTAANACIAAGGLPKDTELLARLLNLDQLDHTLLCHTLEALLDACERVRPKNWKTLSPRLAILKTSLSELRALDPNALDIVTGLLNRFG